jgi:methylmalonyl-CoA mutase cobalamin-binding domain/chain
MQDQIAQGLASLEREATMAAVADALAAGTKPAAVLSACQEGMLLVGQKFAASEYFISDLMLAADIFKEASAQLGLGSAADSGAHGGAVIIGTAHGDVHDIGKDLVVSMLRAAAYNVTDLGVDVTPERFVEAAKETGAKVVGLSGLLTISFDAMKRTVEALKEAGLRDSVKVMVGGGPTDAGACAYIGADAWGHDATDAIKLCKTWIEE